MKSLPALSVTIAAMLALTLALGGCGKKKAPDQASAAGEILPRSVSDDMLPYDTVRSQAQLANPDAGKDRNSTGKPEVDATGSADETDSAVTGKSSAGSAAQAPEVTPDAE